VEGEEKYPKSLRDTHWRRFLPFDIKIK